MQQNKWVWILLVIIIGVALSAFGYHVSDTDDDTMTESGAMGTSSYATSSTSPRDTSDAAITQDTAAIDSQMQGVSDDNATVNEGLGTATQQ